MSGGAAGGPGEAPDDGVVEAVRAANRARRRGGEPEPGEAVPGDPIPGDPSRRLAVYGSLAPGKENHHVVADLAGSWEEGFVRGVLHPEGWGATMGYPALRWDPGGERIAVHLLTSDDLPGAWPRLDRFEGPAYRRIWIPVERPGKEPVVANLYALTEASR